VSGYVGSAVYELAGFGYHRRHFFSLGAVQHQIIEKYTLSCRLPFASVAR
jgi:hypothetical protein